MEDYKLLYLDLINDYNKLQEEYATLELKMKELEDELFLLKKRYNFKYLDYLKLKEEKLTDDQIAAKYGINIRTLYRYLEPYRKPKTANKKSKFNYQEYISLKKRGLNDATIAKKLNISPSTLCRYLKSYH